MFYDSLQKSYLKYELCLENCNVQQQCAVFQASLISQDFQRQNTLGPISRGTTQDVFSSQFFRYFEMIIFCFVVAICDLVHDAEAIHGLC